MRYALVSFLLIICLATAFSAFGYPKLSQAQNNKILIDQEEAKLDRETEKTTNSKVVQKKITNVIEHYPEYKEGDTLIDEFNGSDLNPNFWNKSEREKNYNNELQAYVPENVFLENGFLVLKASKEDSKYKSGLVDTKSKVEFLYCTVEVRLKYPQGKSFFPAVWMLPSNDRSFPETDIFEVVGHHPETVYFVHHYMENGEKKKTCESTEIVDYLDFHTYKFEWTPYELIWFLDGEIVHRTKKNIYDKPMYLIMNFAVGGIWPGDPNEDTVFPSNVYIDYVRITPYVPEEKLEGIN